MNLVFSALDTIQRITLVLFLLLAIQCFLGIGLGIGYLVESPLYNTIIGLNQAFNRQTYFSIYAAHLLLIISSGLVAVPIVLGILGIVQRRWRFLMTCLAFLSLYMAALSGSVACGFAIYDQLDPTLKQDSTQTNAQIWTNIQTTYNCTRTNCIQVLETAMYANKQRIGIISSCFLLVPLLTSIMIILHMRRDLLYFK
ncbi:unnamed protein product [Didymodactylos carnosus]|uniref:Tetraspanin n=1 Tax=Didymodactylos carnosus TaxID=1234261 RepID=A0A813R366_9BILA|nr:unnamed protein product [Didymodactylos carnosus]CAF3558454.1 unnamed protein product [Didymodactylos carnosus]